MAIFNGKIHYFDWVMFNSYVKLPEGIGYRRIIVFVDGNVFLFDGMRL